MRKERVIRIKDLQSTPEGDNGIETTAYGYLMGNADDYTLGYEEDFGDGMKSRTKIIVKGQKSASILRVGDINSEITVETGKRHSCRYSTPYGEMLIGVYAQDVFSSMGPRGGQLELNYTVDCNGSLIARKQMVIDVSDAIR